MAEKVQVQSYQVIQSWKKNGVPAEHCPAIERATEGAVRCEDLRPDVEWSVIRENRPRPTLRLRTERGAT